MSLRAFLVVAVSQAMLPLSLGATECMRHGEPCRRGGLSPSSGIFDASTTTYLNTALGNGIPAPKAVPELKTRKSEFLSLFLTATLPLVFLRRRRRR
jgi:hypothetical protein